MKEKIDEQIYCSVDLEFTGFDPSRDQILEIGFAFFTVSENGCEILEQWSQVFKPSIEVHPKILGLTGITQEELDAAPEFNEYRDFLQVKLGDAIIVGHNPVMDVKFLESYGIKLSGKTIDTLELVQFILPTHHSYNLENLVHYFNIQHSVAHRALGDAVSTIYVLENLLQVHQQFPKSLKSRLKSVIARGQFEWAELLEKQINKKSISNEDSLNHISVGENLTEFQLQNSLITMDSNLTDHEARVAKGLQKNKENFVLAVEDSSTVMKLWKAKLVHGLFQKEDTFSVDAFEKFLETAETSEQLRFCLKIIVWQHINWQAEVVLDLNISFFGGQFRQFIVGGKIKPTKEKVICLDFHTLKNLTHSEQKEILDSRNLIVCGIQSFEKYISDGFGTRLSWNSVLYSLKMIYNPETDFGNKEAKNAVIAALTATDLFFSLVYMLLHQNFPAHDYVSLTNLPATNSYVFNRLRNAAGTLQEKLVKVVEIEKTSDVTRVISFLTSIFTESEDRVKWVTLDESNLSFHDQPVNIEKDTAKILNNFLKVQFTETLIDSELLFYYVERLGLHTEHSEFPKEIEHTNFEFELIDKQLSNSEIFTLATNSELPLVLAFNNQPMVKSFYNEFYKELKLKSALFAQGYSGGGNKMFRNFSIRRESTLLLTPEFMAKQNYVIPVKTIAFIGIPQVKSEHPYVAALLKKWDEHFPNLESLLSLAKIYSALKKIQVNDKVCVKFCNLNFQNEKKSFFVDKLR